MEHSFNLSLGVLVVTAFSVALAYVVGNGVYLLPVLPALAYQCWGGEGLVRCHPCVFVTVLAFSALVGVCVSKFGPVCLPFNMLLVWCAVSVLLVIARARLYAAYAVALLPVMFFNGRWRFVLVVVLYALLLLGVDWLRAGRSFAGWDGVSASITRKSLLRQKGLQLALLLPLFAFESVQGNYFLLLPCLFFAFAELCDDVPKGLGLSADQLCLQAWYAVLLGAAADLVVMNVLPLLGIPETGAIAALFYVVAVVSVLSFLLVVFGERLFAPVLGMALFPFLRDGDIAYVYAVDAGFVYVLLAAFAYRRISHKT